MLAICLAHVHLESSMAMNLAEVSINAASLEDVVDGGGCDCSSVKIHPHVHVHALDLVDVLVPAPLQRMEGRHVATADMTADGFLFQFPGTREGCVTALDSSRLPKRLAQNKPTRT